MRSIWTLDRIEDGTHAVLVADDGAQRVVRIAALPASAAEGDVLREVEGDDGVAYVIDVESTERMRREAAELRQSLRRGPSGPISL